MMKMRMRLRAMIACMLPSGRPKACRLSVNPRPSSTVTMTVISSSRLPTPTSSSSGSATAGRRVANLFVGPEPNKDSASHDHKKRHHDKQSKRPQDCSSDSSECLAYHHASRPLCRSISTARGGGYSCSVLVSRLVLERRFTPTMLGPGMPEPERTGGRRRTTPGRILPLLEPQGPNHQRHLEGFGLHIPHGLQAIFPLLRAPGPRARVVRSCPWRCTSTSPAPRAGSPNLETKPGHGSGVPTVDGDRPRLGHRVSVRGCRRANLVAVRDVA